MSRHITIILSLGLIVVFGFLVQAKYSSLYTSPAAILPLSVSAEDEEDEEEYEDDEEESSPASSTQSTPKTKTILVPQAPVTVTKWVSVTKQVPADGYGTDSDNDGLVDALDPHPTIPEQRFFTDSDGDSVPDSDDAFPGHDDFFAFPNESDSNQNGILDTSEASFSSEEGLE